MVGYLFRTSATKATIRRWSWLYVVSFWSKGYLSNSTSYWY